MKTLILFTAIVLTVSIGNSQTIQDNTNSILIDMLGVDYQEVLKQIQQEETTGMGSLFDHDVIEGHPEYYEIIYKCLENNKTYIFRYSKNEDMDEHKNKIVFQREFADISQLNYYIGTLNNSNLYKSEERWVWFEYSYSCGDIKYDLYLDEKQEYLILDIVYTF